MRALTILVTTCFSPRASSLVIISGECCGCSFMSYGNAYELRHFNPLLRVVHPQRGLISYPTYPREVTIFLFTIMNFLLLTK